MDNRDSLCGDSPRGIRGFFTRIRRMFKRWVLGNRLGEGLIRRMLGEAVPPDLLVYVIVDTEEARSAESLLRGLLDYMLVA